jgi:type IV fimbrial biogenesis protein FimT
MTAMRRLRGFTLIELMITLSLAAIILTLAVPAFRDIILNNRAAVQSNELVTTMNVARSEAVRRGARVSVCASSDQSSCTGGTNWAVGWIVFVDGAANDLAPPVVDGEPIRVWDPITGGATLTGPSAFRYRPLGDVVAPGVLEHRRPSCSGDQGRNIAVNAAGQARVVRVTCP